MREEKIVGSQHLPVPGLGWQEVAQGSWMELERGLEKVKRAWERERGWMAVEMAVVFEPQHRQQEERPS